MVKIWVPVTRVTMCCITYFSVFFSTYFKDRNFTTDLTYMLSVPLHRYNYFVDQQGLRETQCVVFAHHKKSGGNRDDPQLGRFWQECQSCAWTTIFGGAIRFVGDGGLRLDEIWKKCVVVFCWKKDCALVGK